MSRHDVLAVEIRDPREQELPDVGELWLVDPETGRQVRVDTRSRALRERFAAAAAEERSGVARVLSALGVPHVVLSTVRRLAARVRRLPRERAGELRAALALIALVAVPLALLVLWRAQRAPAPRRRPRASLEPRAAARTSFRACPAGCATSRSVLLLLALVRADRRRRAAARERDRPAQGGDRRARDRRLALDDGEGRRRRRGSTRRAARRDAFLDEGADARTASRSSRFGTRAFVARAADDATARSSASALAQPAPERGHRARRRDPARGASSGSARRRRTASCPPTTVLLISDGARDGGRIAPLAAARSARKALGVPVSTVLVGTPNGIVTRKLIGGYQEQIRVPPSPGTLQADRADERRQFFRARTRAALDRASTRSSRRASATRRRTAQITDLFAGGAIVLLLVGGGLSVLWFRRVP